MTNGSCRYCGAKLYPDAKFCTKCKMPVGSKRENYCENTSCSRHIEKFCFDEDDIYCDKCKGLTTIGKEIEKYS